ncbi:unnamed protein product [Effrenium voratum]|uniref:Uncharacterized protein n=1 Tax=Effrenium voratum TaxID=2562239 RepID=A0AA36I7D2_9DINO|nr:unnamed protein product [Effrenium voratum]
MKRPATRGGVAGAAASGGQAMQKQGQRTQKKPAAAQNQKLSEPLRRRVDWSRVTAAQLLECREDYQDAKAYNAGHGHGVPSYREYARSHFLATQRAQDLKPEALRQNLAGRGRP